MKRKRKPVPGRELRIAPTRATKDGTFLDELVERGLIEVAAGKVPAAEESSRVPPQFLRLYRLTKLGEHAAEYGECEVEVKSRLATEVARPAGGR